MSSSNRGRTGVDEAAPAVYAELRRVAAAYIRREPAGQTLQATALVHEAYLRLAGAGRSGTIRSISSGLPPGSCARFSWTVREHGAPKNGGARWIGCR
jgi:hypothetical protein